MTSALSNEGTFSRLVSGFEATRNHLTTRVLQAEATIQSSPETYKYPFTFLSRPSRDDGKVLIHVTTTSHNTNRGRRLHN